MLHHLHLVCWVVKAFLVALTLSGSGCNHAEPVSASPLAGVKWDTMPVDVSDAGKSAGEKIATEPAKGCPACGPDCKCSSVPNNPDCKCPKCPKCGRCACQCECDKAEAKATPKGFTGLLWLSAPFQCYPCDQTKATVASMREFGWDESRLRFIEHSQRGEYPGLWTPTGFPYCYVMIDGKPVRGHPGALSSYQMRDLWEKKEFGSHWKSMARRDRWHSYPEGVTAMRSSAAARRRPVVQSSGSSYCRSCR